MIGTRERPSQEQRAALASEFMAPLRDIVGCGRLALKGIHNTDAQVRAELGVEHPEAAMIAERLRLTARVFKDGSAGLRALLQTNAAQE